MTDNTPQIELSEWQCELCGEWIEPDEVCIAARQFENPPDWPTKHCHIDCLDAFYGAHAQ